MIRKLTRWCLLTLLLWGGSQSSAFAQQSNNFIPDKLKIKTAKKSGWFPDLDLGFNFSFAQSDGVVGVPDGTTLSFGVQLSGGLLYSSGPHEWRTTLKITHTQTKTPTLKPFLKSADQALLETVYTFRFQNPKWLGQFVSAALDTALLDGFLVKEANTRAEITELDGTKTSDDIIAQTPFGLTKGFAPLMLKQSLGVVLNPFTLKPFRMEVKAGGGAIEAFVQNSIRLEDNADTADVVEMKRLQDYIQAGLELKLEIAGVLFDKVLNYALKAGAMLPLYSSVTNNLTTLELLNFDVQFTVGLKLNKWLSINYKLGLVQAPLIQPLLQVTNNLILSLSTSIL